MHVWNDEWEHWDELYKCVEWVYSYLKRYRISGYVKEKWGTLRCDIWYGWSGLLSITHPSHVSYNGRYPKWLTKLDFKFFSKIINLLNVVIVPVQIWLIKRMYRIAVKKFPNIKDEIMSCYYIPRKFRKLRSVSDE